MPLYVMLFVYACKGVYTLVKGDGMPQAAIIYIYIYIEREIEREMCDISRVTAC